MQKVATAKAVSCFLFASSKDTLIFIFHLAIVKHLHHTENLLLSNMSVVFSPEVIYIRVMVRGVKCVSEGWRAQKVPQICCHNPCSRALCYGPIGSEGST